MHWQTQAGNILNNRKIKVNLFLPEFIKTKIASCELYVDECH